MAIWFSSGAFQARQIAEILSEAQEVGIHGVELSSGMAYEENILGPVRAARDQGQHRFMVHNYFPPPEVPFVLNVAALDEENLNRTLQMGITGLELAKEFDAPFYSLHAGFAARLKPEQLGRPTEQARSLTEADIDREGAYEVMLNTVRELADHAANLGLEILLENNVIAPAYLERMPVNPLLLTNAEEVMEFFADIDRPNVGLLFDVAHAKVSGTALGFRPEKFLETVAEHVRCLHLSDNDGTEDTNQPFDESSWFVPLLSDFADREVVVEAYRLTPPVMLSQRDLLEKVLY